jgi:hypothetical protein
LRGTVFLSAGGYVVFRDVSGGWDFLSAYHKVGGIVELQRLTEIRAQERVFEEPEFRKM